jgi:hypothetical protein
MKALILTALMIVTLGAATARAGTDSLAYQTPAHNYYQNSWMNG